MKNINVPFIVTLTLVITVWVFIALSIANIANASTCSNWISESEFQKSVEGLPAKAGCKKQEKCFCYDGVDLAISKIGYKEIDDRSKPIYEYADFEKFEYQDVDTEELIRGEACPSGFEVSRSERDCEKLSGYEQKLVEGLIVDEERKVSVTSQREQEKAQRKAKKEFENQRNQAREDALEALTRRQDGTFRSKQEIQEIIEGMRGNRL